MSTDETFPTSLDELAFLLEEVPRSLRRKFDERTQEHGLGSTQWRILAYLLRDPGMSQTELARCLELERMTISLALEKMEKSGLIERRRSSKDRRVQLVYAMPKARSLLPELRREADANYADMLKGISDGRISDLRKTMELLAVNLR
jgi:MarR family transcriptional regulator for hemolysin